MNFNGTYYYYVRNGQGDIIKLIDGNNATVVEYSYDSWGKLLSTTGTLASTLGAQNPFRYRGYVYDTETGLYYLQSRYYDPEVGRFVNADIYVSTGQGLLGNNMYVYCLNNPSNLFDPEGASSNVLMKGVIRPIIDPVIALKHFVMANSSSLPIEGEPGSSQTLPNPDGTPKQKRWYGPDGKPTRDRDYNHGGENIPFPHDHEWVNGKRQKEHGEPSPDFEFSWEPAIGVGLLTISIVGIVYVAANDATGIGIADDFLFTPFGAAASKGLAMMTN